MKEKIFDEFDDFAEDYRKIHTDNIKISGTDSFYFAEMKVKLLVDSESNTSLKVLDVGCGDGTTEIYFQKYFPNWNLTGIDVSEKSINVANEKDIRNAAFFLFDGLVIPFKDLTFDIIFIAGVLHHVNFDYHELLIKEINRVLKSKGRLYLFEHNPINPLTRYLVNTCIFDKDAKMLQNNYCKKLLLSNNFEIQDNNFIIFFPRNALFKKIIWIEKYFKWLPLGGQYFIKACKF